MNGTSVSNGTHLLPISNEVSGIFRKLLVNGKCPQFQIALESFANSLLHHVWDTRGVE